MTAEPYAALAAEVLRRPPRLGATRLVCVDGPSGAGKTAFADALAGALAARLAGAASDFQVPVVHTDDLLDGWDDQLTFWPRLERRVLAPVRDGRPGRYRAYDWHRGGFGPDEVTVPAGPVLVVEGVSAARAAARTEATLTVLVTAPAALRMARALARDGEAVRPYLDRWRRGEERHFAADATAASVDVIVDGAASGPGGYVRIGGGWPGPSAPAFDGRAGVAGGPSPQGTRPGERGGGDDDRR